MHCNCGFMLFWIGWKFVHFQITNFHYSCVYSHTQNFLYNHISHIETQRVGVLLNRWVEGENMLNFFQHHLRRVEFTKLKIANIHTPPPYGSCFSTRLFSFYRLAVFIHPSLPSLLFSLHVSSFPTLHSVGPPADGVSRSSSQTDLEDWSVRTRPHWLRLGFIELLKHATVVATQPSFFFFFFACLPRPTHWSHGDKTGSVHWHTVKKTNLRWSVGKHRRI